MDSQNSLELEENKSILEENKSILVTYEKCEIFITLLEELLDSLNKCGGLDEKTKKTHVDIFTKYITTFKKDKGYCAPEAILEKLNSYIIVTTNYLINSAVEGDKWALDNNTRNLYQKFVDNFNAYKKN